MILGVIFWFVVAIAAVSLLFGSGAASVFYKVGAVFLTMVFSILPLIAFGFITWGLIYGAPAGGIVGILFGVFLWLCSGGVLVIIWGTAISALSN